MGRKHGSLNLGAEFGSRQVAEDRVSVDASGQRLYAGCDV